MGGARPVGSFSAGCDSGTIAAGAAGNSPFFSFRGSASLVCIIRRITVQVMSKGTGFTAGEFHLELHKASAFTASDTGGTEFAPATGQNKKYSALADSTVQSIQCATTGMLTAGTRTVDPQTLYHIHEGVSTATNTTILDNVDITSPGVDAAVPPIVLAPGSEGFVIEMTPPATGTWSFVATVHWDEVTNF